MIYLLSNTVTTNPIKPTTTGIQEVIGFAVINPKIIPAIKVVIATK